MKKKVILLSLALMMAFVGIVSAATKWGTFEGYTIVRLIINGDVVTPKDTPPVILKDRTMVPISMLEDAGLEVTWDPETYSVNVSSGEPSTNELKDLVLISDLYKQLCDIGDNFTGFSNSLSIAFNGLHTLNDRTALDNSYKYLNGYIDMYNNKVDYINNINKSLTDKGYDLTPAFNTLDYYFKSIDYYKAAQSSLENYSNSHSDDYFNSYMDNTSQGFNAAADGRDIATPEYADFINKILD